MKQTNLSIFIPHLGCPNMCSFCNQRYISGSEKAPSPNEVEEVLKAQQPVLEKHEQAAEIAFFGGSFTAIDENYRNSLLEIAQRYCNEYPEQFCGIRCSTRPDCIDEKTLETLKNYGMTAIELGAQSMSDEVLAANNRGHSADDVRKASMLIKDSGIELGLQMMTGLYLDTRENCIITADEFVKLKPKTVRVYPTVILENTRLAELFKSGVYKSFSFEETVDLCALLLEKFEENDIAVIRMGLHASDGVEKTMLGGVYHPALREIVESRIVYKKMRAKMQANHKYIVHTDKTNMSRVIGHKGANRARLLEKKITFKLKEEQGEFLRIEEI